MDSEDTDVLAYGDSGQREVRKKCQVLLGNVGPLYMSDEEEGADKNVSKDTTSVEMKGERGTRIVLLVYGWTTRYMRRLRRIRKEMCVTCFLRFFICFSATPMFEDSLNVIYARSACRKLVVSKKLNQYRNFQRCFILMHSYLWKSVLSVRCRCIN